MNLSRRTKLVSTKLMMIMGLTKLMIIVGLALALNSPAQATEATYYRFWQGFKKADLTHAQFLNGLPDFVTKAPSLYANYGLSNYIVLMPPSQKPSFIPDEFALLAFDSEQSYRAARATPEGKQYGDDHWTLFDKNISKSADMLSFTGGITSLQPNAAYNIIGKPVDLAKGVTFAFVGLRKPEISKPNFLRAMASHVRLVAKTLGPKGLKGYLILATEEYEIAYMVWESQAHADAAFASPEGALVQADANKSLNLLIWKKAASYTGGSISDNEVYETSSLIQ